MKRELLHEQRRVTLDQRGRRQVGVALTLVVGTRQAEGLIGEGVVELVGQRHLAVEVEAGAGVRHPHDDLPGLGVVVPRHLALQQLALQRLQIGALGNRAQQLQHTAVEVRLLGRVLGFDRVGELALELVAGLEVGVDAILELQAAQVLDDGGDGRHLLFERPVDGLTAALARGRP